MPLDDLLDLIETLRKRIDEHGPALRQYEAQTRYVLIDALLRGLGWDTEDPAQVTPEFPIKKGFFSSGKRFVDYALLNGSKPPTLIEAKSLGTPLRDDALDQGMSYCWREGINHLVVTDGQLWEIYDVRKRGGSDDTMRIVEFDVTEPPAEVSLKALALWRPSVVEGHVRAGEEPVVRAAEPATVAPAPEAAPQWQCPECGREYDQQESQRIARHKQEHTLRPQAAPPPAPPNADARQWISLADVEGKPYTKPHELLVPSGESIPATSWTDLTAQLTQWLVGKGLLSEDSTPIRHGKRYLLATKPTHPTGKKFINARKVGPLWLNSNYAAADHVRNVRLILSHAGMDPADFKVRLAD